MSTATQPAPVPATGNGVPKLPTPTLRIDTGVEPVSIRNVAQRVLDAAEDFTTRHRWIGLTFALIAVKDRLGLRIER